MTHHLAPPAGDPRWIGRAVKALRCWNPVLTRREALLLLATWRHGRMLTDAQRRAVLAEVTR